MTPEIIRIIAYMDYATEVRGCGTICKSTAIDNELWFVLVNNRRAIGGYTPLMHAAYSGNLERCAMLLRHGARINTKDKEGWSALAYAIRGGQPAVVQFLCSRGADISDSLRHASFTHGPDIAHMLCSLGALGCDINGMNLLMDYSRCGKIDMVATLIRDGTALNAVSSGGVTALMHAAFNGHIDVVRLLMKAGASVYKQDNFGGTARSKALLKGYAEIASLLEGGL
jgi:ankyrin repeat protein